MGIADTIVGDTNLILVTGASGFIGSKVVEMLLKRGFKNIRCFVRPSSNLTALNQAINPSDEAKVDVIEGNLVSRDDCERITEGVSIIYHLAAGRGEKSYPDAYLNSVVTTRNLLEACLQHGSLKRFANVSSFAVYTNRDKPRGRVLDETCPVEQCPALRGTAYCFAKVKQEEMVIEYGKKHDLSYTIIRPGVVYGPGNEQIHGRVGIGTFGVFLHLGGLNKVPLTYIDNCAEAIVLTGIVKGIDGEVFNVVDDDLPSSRRFLRLYKKEVKRFPSIYVPRFLSYTFCYLWEKYSSWSQGQLPNTFNRRVWEATWKKTYYTNEKLRERLGWRQKISTSEGLNKYFESCREKMRHA